jgi:hypothetical protein
MSSMSTDLASRVYQVLVQHCGAPADEASAASFIHYFTKPNPGSEYRFVGSLGFGGKFRFPRFTVDCYPEHETAARLAAIRVANEHLSPLVREFAASLNLNT